MATTMAEVKARHEALQTAHAGVATAISTLRNLNIGHMREGGSTAMIVEAVITLEGALGRLAYVLQEK